MKSKDENPKSKKPVRLNALTERLLTSNGWLCGCTETYNAWGGFSSDFLGVGDYVAISPKYRRTALVQVTTFPNRTARYKKILKSIKAYLWLAGGAEIWLLTWKRTYPDGKLLWVPEKTSIQQKEFSEEIRHKYYEYWNLMARCAEMDIKNHKVRAQQIII